MNSEFEVADLVPHSGNMNLLDEIVDHGDDWLEARVNITSNSMFIEPNGVPALVGIEYLAQAVAAYAGLQESKSGGKPKLGFLLGVRKYRSSIDCFPVGMSLLLKVHLVMQADSGLNVFQCFLTGDGIEASGRLNVFQPEDAEQFLQGAM